jgi:hypothetical protein
MTRKSKKQKQASKVSKVVKKLAAKVIPKLKRPAPRTGGGRNSSVRTRSIPVVESSSIPKPMLNIVPISRGSLEHVEVRGRDVIGAISGASTFSSRYSQGINPLNASLFPKLSALAGLFEKWRPISMTFRYHPACPTSRTGVVGGYVETDVADFALPSNIPGLMNEQFSCSSAAFEPCQFTVTNKEDAEMWYYTQASASAETVGDRTAFVGFLRWYVDMCATADVNVFNGYLSVEYHMQFAVFRPPTASGFELINTNQVILSSATDTATYLSDGKSALGLLGSWASRYLFDGVKELKSDGTDFTYDSQILLPPINCTTTGLTRASFSGDAATGEKVLRARPTVRESFEPYLAIQHQDGSWWYQLVPDGPQYPYAEVKLPAVPDAAGDMTVWVTTSGADGVETVLFTTTVNSSAATIVNLAWSLVPASYTRLRFYVKSVIAAARALTYLYTLVSPAAGNASD